MIRSVHRLSRIPADVPCPGPLPSSDLFNHVCDLGLFLPMCFFSVPVIFSILISIFVCAAATLFCIWVMSDHVDALYIVTGSTHEL